MSYIKLYNINKEAMIQIQNIFIDETAVKV